MDQLRREGFGETDDSAFGRSVINHAARATKGHGRGGVDDAVQDVSVIQGYEVAKTKSIRVTPRHMRKGVFRHCYHLKDVGLQDVQGTVQVSVQEIFVHALL